MKIIFITLLLIFTTSFKIQEKPKLTFEYNKEVQEVKHNLELAERNLKIIDSINNKK